MKRIIYEVEIGKYEIVPKNRFIFFWWAILHNIITLFAPMPYCLTRYYKTVKEANRELIKIQ